jgi:ElaB/YqjD/DUF883 family membrane-anchored ribosome-binding protein
MAEEPEVIQQELEQTRHDLAEKLEQLSEKISGTVETVTETVSNVTETVSNVTEAVGGTVQNVAEAVSGTVESVKETAADTVESIKHAVNLSEQVQKHPWLWFGGSVAAGFVGGKLVGRRRRRTPEAESFIRGGGYYPGPEPTPEPPAAPERDWSRENLPRAAEGTGTRTSWLGSLVQQFGGEINKLKSLALGTLFGVARDMVTQSLSGTLKEQVVDLFNDVTEKAGGEPIQGKVLDENSSETERGGEHEQSHPTAMDRPVGTAEKQSKAAVG